MINQLTYVILKLHCLYLIYISQSTLLAIKWVPVLFFDDFGECKLILIIFLIIFYILRWTAEEDRINPSISPQLCFRNTVWYVNVQLQNFSFISDRIICTVSRVISVWSYLLYRFIFSLLIFTSAKEIMFLPLFVCLLICLLATLLKKFLTDFDEIFRIAWQWYKEQLIKFWGWSEEAMPYRGNEHY